MGPFANARRLPLASALRFRQHGRKISANPPGCRDQEKGTQLIKTECLNELRPLFIAQVLAKETITLPAPLPKNAAAFYAKNPINQETFTLVGELEWDFHGVALPVQTWPTRAGAVAAILDKIKEDGAGPVKNLQSWQFKDQRTGGTENPPVYTVRWSGFEITLDLELSAGKPQIEVSKVGKPEHDALAGTVLGTPIGLFEIK